jgi:hypothetical protein
MDQLVIVVPLKPGKRAEALALIEQGPPFTLEETDFARHEVHLTDREAVFVFEAPTGPTLSFSGEDPALHRLADAWTALMDGKPRKAETVFAWTR